MDKPLHHYDKRIIRRSIKKGILSEEEAASHLTALADGAENIMPPEEESPAEVSAPGGASNGAAAVDSSAEGA